MKLSILPALLIPLIALAGGPRHRPPVTVNTPSATAGANASANSASLSGDSAANASLSAPRQVHSATAPALSTSNGTCMGSSSGGVQTTVFGFSAGATWTDEGCNRRYNAAMLNALGYPRAAVVMMCEDPAVRRAMAEACPALPAADPNEPTDPFIRHRLGLPPLQ